MYSGHHGRSARSIAAIGALGVACSSALQLGAAQAQDKTYEMKISTPTSPTYARNFLEAVEKDFGGRIKAQVYPASQLGSIPRQIEGTQFGSIQAAVDPPEFFVGIDRVSKSWRLRALSTPWSRDSVSRLIRRVRKMMLSLGADKGLRGVGLFMAEPAEVVTKTAIRNLADFKGKRMRIFASQFQCVAFERLGVTPISMSLGDVLPAIQQGAIDGAVFGMGPIPAYCISSTRRNS